MVDSSALLDALLQETEDEDEQPLSAAVIDAFFQSGNGADEGVDGAPIQAEQTGDGLSDLLDLTSLATPSDASTPSDESESVGPSKATGNLRKLSTRQRERAEILRLRVEEKKLHEELVRLQLHRQGQHSGTEGGGAALSSTRNGDVDAQTAQQQTRALWLRVAKSQLERRQEAHIENLKLRYMLGHQLKIMQGMQKLLRKRSAASAEHWMSIRKRQCGLTDVDAMTFARLASDLESRYLETDAVLRESKCADKNKEMQRARVKVHAIRGMYIEFFDAKIVPFAFNDAGDATWNGLQSPEIALSDGVYTSVSASSDAVSAKLSIRLSGMRTEVLVDAKFVARKFTEPERVVIVWQCQTDTDGPLCGDHGVRLLNCGWTVVRDAAASTTDSHARSDHAPTAIIQSCARVMPEIADDPQLKPENVGVLADLVTTSFLRNMDSHHQRTEDILVESLVGSVTA